MPSPPQQPHALDTILAQFFPPENPDHVELCLRWHAALEQAEWLSQTRVSSAWGRGTMTQEDFVSVSDDADVMADLLHAFFAVRDTDAFEAVAEVLGDTIGFFDGGITDNFAQDQWRNLSIEDVHDVFAILEPVRHQRMLQDSLPEASAATTASRVRL